MLKCNSVCPNILCSMRLWFGRRGSIIRAPLALMSKLIENSVCVCVRALSMCVNDNKKRTGVGG